MNILLVVDVVTMFDGVFNYIDYDKYCGKHYIIYGKYCGPHYKGGKWILKPLEMLLWMHTLLQNGGGLHCRFWYFYWMENNVHAKDSQQSEI